MKNSILKVGILAVIFTTLILISCKTAKLETVDPKEVVNKEWFVKEINGKKISTLVSTKGVEPKLIFGKRGDFEAFLGCNTAKGYVEQNLKTGQSRFLGINTTQEACSHEATVETAFLNALKEADRAAFQKKALVLLKGKTILAKFATK